MNESAFATEFRIVVKALEPKAVVFRHVEQFSRDVPDISITLNGKTFWVECKRAWDSSLDDFEWTQEKTHRKMGNVWLLVFGIDIDATLSVLSLYRPVSNFPILWGVLSGLKGRKEAYRAAWSEIRPSFF